MAKSKELLAIDFGTSTIFARVVRTDGTFTPVVFGLSDGGKGFPFLPSVFTAPTGVEIASLKSMITLQHRGVDGSKKIYEDANGIVVTLEQAIIEILVRARKDIEADIGSIDKMDIHLGCPASWNASQRAFIAHCARSAGFKVLASRVFDEATAVLAAAVSAREVASSEKLGLLVFDMGAGTLDLAIARDTESSGLSTAWQEFEAPNVLIESAYSLETAGDAFDIALAELIAQKCLTSGGLNNEERKQAQSFKADLVRETLQKSVVGKGSADELFIADLIRISKSVKEQLSDVADIDAKFRGCKVNISRKELEKCWEPLLDSIFQTGVLRVIQLSLMNQRKTNSIVGTMPGQYLKPEFKDKLPEYVENTFKVSPDQIKT